MIYKPLLPLALAAVVCAAPVKANTTDGLIIGGMAGLTAGFVTSAIARHASHRHHQPRHCHHHHDRVYVEQPTRIIERPVVVEQVIEHRPMVVQERVRTSNVTYQQPTTTHTYHQAPQQAPQAQQHTPQPAPQAIPAPQAPSLMERELALKEQQVMLDLLKEENKKSELKIKEMELELQLKSVRRS